MNRPLCRSANLAFRLLVLTAVLAIGLLTWRPWEQKVTEAAVAAPPASAVPRTVNAPPPMPSSDLESWRLRIAAATAAGFRSLLAEAMGLADDTLRDAVVRELVAAWLRSEARDFHKYFAGLEVEGNERERLQLIAALGSVLPSLDPTRRASEVIRSLVQRMIAGVVGDDPSLAATWASQWLPEAAREAAMVSVVRETARRDPAEALDLAQQLNSPLRRMQGMTAVGRVWGARDPRAALEWAVGIPQSTERAMTLNAVLVSVAQEDPGLAAARLREAEQALSREYRIQRDADLVRLGLDEEALANDPETYRDLLASGAISPPESPDVELMADAGRVIAEKLARTDPTTATAFVGSLENPFLTRKAEAGALAGWVAEDPPGAVAHFMEAYPGNTELIAPLFSTWAGTDPAAAAAGAATLETAAQRVLAFDATIETWAAIDPRAAARHLDALAPVERSDHAVASVVSALSAVQPEEAWSRALGIAEPDLRYRSLRSAFAVLVTDRPEAAQALLASTSLDPDQAERFGEMLEAVAGGTR